MNYNTCILNNSAIFGVRLSTFDGVNRENIIYGFLANRVHKPEKENTRYTVKLSRVSFFSLTIQAQTNLAEYSNCITCDRGMSFTTLFNSSGVTVKYRFRVLGQYKKQVNNGMDENTFLRYTSEPLSWSASQKNEVKIGDLAKQLNTYSTLSISEINHKE